MPKMNRIRIAGLRYEGMKKQYNDIIFDLNDSRQATNALISLVNGGGKGVFLQTIFQILKPGTSWGEKDNRLYQQFFFNEKEKFIPYTFYTMIEWELDGSEKEFLLTGGAFSAERYLNSSDEEEGERFDISPKIQFFSKTYSPNGPNWASEITLKNDGEFKTFDELKPFLEENGFDIYKSISSHYRIIESYGINRKDWSIVKDINKSEGGVGKYFDGATDDQSLFRERIIPIISQVLRKSDSEQDDLFEIFKSQASIAKDLPILMKREKAHREFLEDIIPLEEMIEKGKEHQSKEKQNEDEGLRILSALSHLIRLEEAERSKLEARLEELEKILKHLYYEKDNVEYVKLTRQIDSLQLSLNEKEDKLQKIQFDLTEMKEQEVEFNVAILLKEWCLIQSELKLIKQQIEAIEQSDEMTQLNERIATIEKNSKSLWEQAESSLIDQLTSYRGYSLYATNEVKQLSHQKDEHIEKIAEIKTDIQHLIRSMEQFEKTRNQFVTTYGQKIIFDPHSVLTSSVQELQGLRNDFDYTKSKQNFHQEQKNGLASEIGATKQSIKAAQTHLQTVQNDWDKQNQKEIKIMTLLSQSLQSEIEAISPSLILEYTQQLEHIMGQTQVTLENYKQEYWKLQLSESLNQETYPIANQDLKQIKEQLSAKIDVYYGSEFLFSLEAQEREGYLQNYPLLPFGLIVSERDWKQLQSTDFAQISLQAPIPVFLREKMNGADQFHSFEVISGVNPEMNLDENRFQTWKESIQDDLARVRGLMDELTKTYNFLLSVKQQVESLLLTPLCSELKITIEEIKQEQDRLVNGLVSLEQKDREEKEELELLEDRIRSLSHEIEKAKERVDKLRTFINNWEEHQEHVETKSEKEVVLDRLEKHKSAIEKDLDEWNEETKQWNAVYLRWEKQLSDTLSKMALMNNDMSLPIITDINPSEQVPSLLNDTLQPLLVLWEEYDAIHKSKEQKNMDLIRLQIELSHRDEKCVDKEKSLYKLNPSWKEVSVPVEPVEVLEQKLVSLQADIEDTDQEERSMQNSISALISRVDVLKGQQSQMASNIRSKHGREPVVWDENHLEQKEMNILEEIKQHSKVNIKTKLQLDDITQQISQLDKSHTSLMLMIGERDFAFYDEDLQRVQKNASQTIQEWKKAYDLIKKEEESIAYKAEMSLNKLKANISEKDWELKFKNDILASLNRMQIRQYDHTSDLIKAMKQFSARGLEQLSKDKERAESAQAFWASRAAMKVMSMSDIIRQMIAKMRFKNELGKFPLVELQEDILPKKAEDVEQLLRDHFTSAIDKILKQFESIDYENKALDQKIKELVGDAQIFYVSLRHRYPTLLVYNMQTNNAFTYGRPKPEYYSTWRTINTGSETKSDGSGGQKLSARMIVMMMLLSMKNELDDRWMTLLCDNPFGQAASPHVLDPIFIVAEKLKFQLIIVTPPELVKTEISQRFPVYYKLDFREEKGKEFVKENVQHSFRIYQ